MAEPTSMPQTIFCDLRPDEFPLVIDYLDSGGSIMHTVTIPGPGATDMPRFCAEHRPASVRLTFGNGEVAASPAEPPHLDTP